MGYCNEHDKVYSGAECPVCAGGSPDAQDAAARSRGETEADGADEGGNDAVESSIEETIADAVDDMSAHSEGTDVVAGDQEKTVESSKDVQIDNSERYVDESQEVHDDRTVVEDSVLQDTDVGTDGPATVRDTVAQDSSVAGGPQYEDEQARRGEEDTQTEHDNRVRERRDDSRSTERDERRRRGTDEQRKPGKGKSNRQRTDHNGTEGGNEHKRSQHGGSSRRESAPESAEKVQSAGDKGSPPRCPNCGEDVSTDDTFCMHCGASLQGS